MPTPTSRIGRGMDNYAELVEALPAEAAPEFVAFEERRASLGKPRGRLGIAEPPPARLTGIEDAVAREVPWT